MNRKLKEQLELVIMQCSTLKASLDEALARNRQYEKELKVLRNEPSDAPVMEVAKEQKPELQQEVSADSTLKEAEEPIVEQPDTDLSQNDSDNQPDEVSNEPEPIAEPEPKNETQDFQNILEIGADMVSQAVSSSKEYIARLEELHPEGCSSLTDIIRSRTDLFKVEISGIIGGFGDISEKRERMNSALIKLIQYFENVK